MADEMSMARKIQGLLAKAESAAQLGNEAERDVFLEKATALQLKYAIDDTLLRAKEGREQEKIIFADFCTESNTPLIKAKRNLINIVAMNNRGRAVMLSEWKSTPKGMKLDHRAKIRVWAHESDLGFITVLYTSLITQLQTMMAQDERVEKLRGFRGEKPSAWRVSYAYGWVNRIGVRLAEVKARTETQATTAPGTALVLRDRGASVGTFVTDAIGKTRKTNYKLQDTSAAGRASGYAAAGRADLGQDRVGSGGRPALGS